ncbi:DUF5719 family protein [Solicola sp. PLA-1-18]|uniref:DUF5719 family protein n=1 Tax=Solicola sp. PLA-1-18 TaxID=3380532 RepID=UPI003B7E94F0
MSTPSPGGGRRVRVEPRRASAPVDRRPLLLAVVVVLVAALLLGVSSLRGATPDEPAAAPSPTAVTTVSTTCPVPGVGERRPDQVGLVTGSADVGVRREGDGTRTARVLPGGGEVAAVTGAEPGAWTSTTVPSSDALAVALGARGSLAPGAVGLTAAVAPAGLGGGLAAADCAAPARDRWFVGAGTSAERAGTLVLANPGEGPAVVDVSLHGADGEIETVGGAGVVVDPGATREVALDDLAAGTDDVAVEVVTRRGAVGAALLDSAVSADAQPGTDWVPAAASPSRRQVVPGGLRGADSRSLTVANPGPRTATVQVEVLGPDGRYAPRGAEELQVPAAGIASIDLPGSVSAAPFGVALTSTEPVTGGLESRVGDDAVHTAATPEARAPVAVPVAVPVGSGSATVTVQLSAADDAPASTVAVRGYDAAGEEVARGRVQVPAGASVALDPSAAGALEGEAGAVVSLVLDPGDVPVHAAAVVRGSGGVSVVPLRSAPGVVAAPAVSPLP